MFGIFKWGVGIVFSFGLMITWGVEEYAISIKDLTERITQNITTDSQVRTFFNAEVKSFHEKVTSKELVSIHDQVNRYTEELRDHVERNISAFLFCCDGNEVDYNMHDKTEGKFSDPFFLSELESKEPIDFDSLSSEEFFVANIIAATNFGKTTLENFIKHNQGINSPFVRITLRRIVAEVVISTLIEVYNELVFLESKQNREDCSMEEDDCSLEEEDCSKKEGVLVIKEWSNYKISESFILKLDRFNLSTGNKYGIECYDSLLKILKILK